MTAIATSARSALPTPAHRTAVATSRAEWILLLFIATQVCAGVLRWLLGKTGLAAAIYLPTALLWAHIAWIALHHALRNDLSMSALALGGTLLLAAFTGFLSLPLKQVIFGLWVLTPLVYGYAIGTRIDFARPALSAAAAVLLAIAVAGVLFDQYFDCPWVGANFELAGKEISGSRDWYISGHRRLAGFARSSFDAAGQITVFAVVVNAGLRSRMLRWLVWALALVGVGYTTARGVLLAMFVAILVIEAPRALRGLVARTTTAVGFGWISLPPLLAWTVDFSQMARLQLGSSYGSYLDRMSGMWPEAFRLLTDAPLPPLGRGIGGIGAAQPLFEPGRFNAADNLLVYQGVVLGAMSLPIIAVFLLSAWQRAVRVGTGDIATGALCLIVLWYGAVSNIVEHPVLAIVYGAMISLGFATLMPVHHSRRTRP